MSAGQSSNFSLLSFCYVHTIALPLEVKIATTVPGLTLPNYSRRDEQSKPTYWDPIWLGQYRSHVRLHPISVVKAGTGLACSDWLSLGHVLQAQDWWHQRRVCVCGGGGRAAPLEQHGPLVQNGSGDRKTRSDFWRSSVCRVLILLALVSFPSDPYWVSGQSQMSTISKRNAQSSVRYLKGVVTWLNIYAHLV